VLIVISVAVFRPGPWTTTRWVGLGMAVSGRAAVRRTLPVGQSFSVTPQARELVTHGLYSKIRNPIYVFSALMLTVVKESKVLEAAGLRDRAEHLRHVRSRVCRRACGPSGRSLSTARA